MASDDLRPTLRALSQAEAQSFWASSPQASPFTDPRVLSKLCDRIVYLAAYESDTALCLWPIAIDAGGKPTLPQFSYYLGPYWSAAAQNISERKWLLLQAGVYRAFLQSLLAEYGMVTATLLPALHDLRGFIWCEREQDPACSLSLVPRYTAQIARLQQHTPSSLFAGLARNRRRLLHRFEREAPPVECAWRTEDCLRLYHDVMRRQGFQDVSSARISAIETLCQLVREGLGFIRAYAMDGSQEAAAFRLVLTSPNMACDVLSAASDVARDQYIVSWLGYQTVLGSLAAGCAVHDFNGANSAKRAADVLSYGAESALYFSLSASVST